MRTLAPMWWLLALACGDPTPATPQPADDVSVGLLDRDGDGATEDVDCDDADPARYPGADEICDGVDNDCDLEVDDDPVDGIPGYEDLDGDGYGAEPPVIVACERSPALLDRGGDCDDGDRTVHPDAVELCDGIDHDCDGQVGEDGRVSVGDEMFTELQVAIDAASDGDTVHVCAGDFGGPVLLGDRALTIEGIDAASTQLVGDGAGPVVTVAGGALTFRNLTITGGAPTLESSGGGGLRATGAVVTVEDSTFTDNQHWDGGAIYLELGALAVARTAFTDNRAFQAEHVGSGGAILVRDGSVVLDDCTFEDNRAAGFGGGLYASGSTTTITGSTFSRNSADRSGGAAAIYSAVNTITDTTFEDNVSGLDGGAVYASWASLTVVDSVLQDNDADSTGGGLFVTHGDAVLERVEWTENTATLGGALSIQDDCVVQVIDSVIQQNRATDAGGGLNLSGADGTVVHSIGSDWGDGATDNQGGDVGFGAFGSQSFSTEDFSCEGFPVGCY